MIKPYDKKSEDALEQAIKALGEDKRGVVMSIYACGFVDGELSSAEKALALAHNGGIPLEGSGTLFCGALIGTQNIWCTRQLDHDGEHSRN